MEWSVYVDESGKFDGTDPSFVVGLVVRGGPDALDVAWLRRELRDLWGPGPWPPHASSLNFPASRVLYAAFDHPAAMPAGRYAGKLRGAIRALLPVVERALPERLDALREGDFPTYDDCRAADLATRGRPEHGELRAVAEAQDREMGRLVRRICARAAGFVLGARADDAPLGPDPAPGTLRSDAYLRALTCATERLHRLGGAHPAELFVLARHVEAADLGTIQLQGFHLRGLLASAAERTRSPLEARLGAASVHYREKRDGPPLHPLLVVADWLANGVRQAAGRFRGGYPALEASILDDLLPHPGALRATPARLLLSRGQGRTPPPDAPLPQDLSALAPLRRPMAADAADGGLRSPRASEVGALPTLGAAGLPEDVIRAALAGGVIERTGTRAPAWVWDQADEWVATAGRWA